MDIKYLHAMNDEEFQKYVEELKKMKKNYSPLLIKGLVEGWDSFENLKKVDLVSDYMNCFGLHLKINNAEDYADFVECNNNEKNIFTGEEGDDLTYLIMSCQRLFNS